MDRQRLLGEQKYGLAILHPSEVRSKELQFYAVTSYKEPFPTTSAVSNRWGTCPYSTNP